MVWVMRYSSFRVDGEERQAPAAATRRLRGRAPGRRVSVPISPAWRARQQLLECC